MLPVEDLPALNATLNCVATILIIAGWICIKAKKQSAHIAFMVLALLVSTAFLTSYLIYHYHVGSVKFPGKDPFVRVVYFTMLITHIVLAIVNVPLIIMTVVPALRRRFDKHKRIARWAMPSWLYVSVTGVFIYFMCYQWFVRG
jgi:putative membrane protein